MTGIGRLLAALTLIVAVSARAQTQAPAPTEPLAIIELDSLDAFLGDSLRFTTALALPPVRQSIIDAMTKGLGLKSISSIDSKRPVRAFIYAATSKRPGAEPLAAVEIPVLQGGAPFLAELAGSFSSRTEEGALIKFSDRMFIPPGQKDAMYVRVQGNVAFVGQDSTSVTQAADAMQTGRYTETLPRIPGTLRVGVNMPAVVQMMSETMTAMQNDFGTGSGTEAAPKLKTEELQAVLRQIRSISLSISSHANTCDIYARLQPRQGTAMETWVKGIRPPSEAYLSRFAPDSALAIAAGGLNGLEFFTGPYSSFAESLYQSMGPQMAPMGAAMRDALTQMNRILAGEMMIAVVPVKTGRGAALVEAFSVKDPKTAMDWVLKMMGSYNEDFGKASGIRLKTLPTRTHADSTLHAFGYDIDPKAMNEAGGPALGFLNQFKWELTVADRNLVYALGDSNGITEHLDRMAAGKGTDIRQLQPFADLFPEIKGEQPVALYSIGFMRLIKCVLALVPGVDAQILAMLPDSKGGLAGYNVVRDGNLLGLTRIGYNEINVIKDSSSMIGAAFMQAMMKNMAQGNGMTGGDAGALDARCINNLRMLDAAKEQYAMEQALGAGQPLPPAAIQTYLIGGTMPECPAGGSYSLGNIGEKPTCSNPDHKLP